MDDHRPLFDNTGADAVGALAPLAPVGAVPQPGSPEVLAQAGLHPVVENHALGIGEHQRIAGAGNLGRQIVHFTACKGNDLGQLVAMGAELAARQHVQLDTRRVQPVVANTAIPGTRHQIGRVAMDGCRRRMRRQIDHRCSSLDTAPRTGPRMHIARF